ncbi:Endoribonuclease L-PSP/chorismate mutase-like protein [Aspergillus spinulosporus]
MSNLSWTKIPGTANRDSSCSHVYSQAVRVENTVHLSGQGGWDTQTQTISSSVPHQIDQAFANINAILRAAGGKGWGQVYKARSYHLAVDVEAQDSIARNFGKWMPEHKPLWTCVQVGRLAKDGMKVEIEVEAHVPVGVKELDA